MKLWMRLGGYVNVDEATAERIMQGDADALADALLENGFTADGDAHIPDDHGDIVAEFDLGPIKLF